MPRDHLVYPVQAAKQAQQAAWHLYVNFRGLPMQKGNVSNELNRITQSVQAAHNDTFACESSPAPEPVGIGRRTFCDTIAFAPSAREISAQHVTVPAPSATLVRIKA
jgi:hypothetical protein